MDDRILAKMANFSSKLNDLLKLPNLNSKERNYLYSYAANKCQIGDFKSSIPLFQFLVLMEPNNQFYIKGLAGAMHGVENYQAALELYRIIYLLDNKVHLDTLYYMGDCYLKLNLIDEAWEELNLFVTTASGEMYKEKYEEQLKRAKLLLAGVLKKD